MADTKINDFNADGLPVSQTWTLDQDTYTVGYTWTADGKPATVVYPAVNDGSQVLDAETVTYAYDGAGRAESITSSFGSYTYLRDTSYTDEGQPSYWGRLGPQVTLDGGLRDTANRTWLYD